MPRRTKVFISYKRSTNSLETAEKLSQFLTGQGFDVFWDIRKLKAGHDWADTIYDNIFGADRIVGGDRGSDVLIVLLEQETALSDWVQREVDTARGAHVSILPIRLTRDVSIAEAQEKLDLRRHQYLDYEDTHFEDKLLASLDDLSNYARERQELLINKLRYKWNKQPIDDYDYTPSHARFKMRKPEHPCTIHQALYDITEIRGVDGKPIDVIVNSENDYMQMARIFESNRVSSMLRLRGSKIREKTELIEEDTVQVELDRQVQVRVGCRPLAMGEVLYTNAGHSESVLRREYGFRYIIHAATVPARELAHRTPPTNPNIDREDLKNCVINCLKAVDEINALRGVITPEIYDGEAQRQLEESAASSYQPVESIVFPLIATGHTNARLHLSVDAMSRGIIHYLRRVPDTTLRHIYICVYLQDDVDIVTEELSKSFERVD